ncbi:nucleotidyltransferase family protein [Rhodococcus qingshengii]
MRVDAIGIVLAAGAGSRYGSPKVLAHNGEWLDSAVSALTDGGCSHVLVVLGAAETLVPPGATAVWALHWRSGLSSSLRTGLNEAGDASFAVVHVVDTPDVGFEVVDAVLDAARATPAHLARAMFDGIPGHPVVFGREHWDSVATAAVGDSGARDFLRGRTDVVAVECSMWATGVDHDYFQRSPS